MANGVTPQPTPATTTPATTTPAATTPAATTPAATTPADPGTEKLRISRAFWLSIFGLSLAAALVVALLIAGWTTSSDIVAVVGLFTSVLGTLVGAFFGLQIGSAGKEKAEEKADTAQKKADALQQAATPDVMDAARRAYPGLFR